MTFTGKQLIGYAATATGHTTFASPAATDVKFIDATPADVHAAAALAAKAFEHYRQLNGATRATFLERIADELALVRASLVETAQLETGLPAARLDGEITRTVNQLKLFASLVREGSWVRAMIDPAQPNRQPLPKADIRQLQVPLGVVGVFGASNFPFAFSVAGGDTASALASGCTVVYKAHPGHPATSEMTGLAVIRAARETGMPEGVFALLQGAGHESGVSLVTHPLVSAIGFTGSLKGGRALFNAASQREEPIPVYAEMGSVNPVIILPGILAEKGTDLAKTLAASNTLGTGQFCTNPGVFLAQDSNDTTSFLQTYAATIAATPADGMLTDAISASYATGVKALENKKDVQHLATGVATEKKRSGIPNTFKTTVSAFLKDVSLQEEVFGPSSIHIVAESKEELLNAIRQLHGQLTLSVWGTAEDFVNFQDIFRVLETKGGRLICNGVPTGVEVTHAMMHGGPYPATSNSKYTSVGTNAIYRFTRPLCYQNFPKHLLPQALHDENPLNLWRMVNGNYEQGPLRA
ncbi:aldehyde dehydrogenase (NADP(+)) [Chryseolinea sp. Jin1]|uniref:Aldehyde dehydrogenase (NADP(+)) n=2 Tax=Chryseolinea lacunae TaxID=2801331 RepID=A0ABS1KWW9_9BACT|nr:aldehyde dehydrogenase (NADP(+)) [Chryseolinea lacunae]